MKVILIRHGESRSNIKECTLKDSALSPRGIQQAEITGAALAGRGIEALYCSAMHRAIHTAHVIGSRIGLQPNVWVDLAEHGMAWTESGLPRSRMLEQFSGLQLPEEVDEEGWARHWSGETAEELRLRAERVRERLLALAEEGSCGTIALIIHGRSGSMLLQALLQIPAGIQSHFEHGNCGITELEILSQELVIVRSVNEEHHLREQREGQAQAWGSYT